MIDEILGRICDFSSKYGHDIAVGGMKWRYYRLGDGPPVFWLAGGLRRAAFGFAFLECPGLADIDDVYARPSFPLNVADCGRRGIRPNDRQRWRFCIRWRPPNMAGYGGSTRARMRRY